MKAVGRSSLTKLLKEESGQILPWMAILSVLFLGMAGLTIDVGRGFVAYRELQASTDAAALAGAYALVQAGATQASVTSKICSFSSNSGSTVTTSCPAGANATPNLPNASPTTTFLCVTDSTLVAAQCSGSTTGYNVVKVVQTSQLPTIFIRSLNAMFGRHAAPAFTLSATSEATMMSGFDKQLNVAIVLDSTASMGNSDSACGTTKIKCALGGVQTLLKMMQPCSIGSSSSTCKSAYDQASLFTFPPMQAQTTGDDTTCPSSNPTITNYVSYNPGATWSAPTGTNGTYQVTGYLDNYSTTNNANGALSTSSAMGVATGASTCQGIQTPGGDGTWLAGSIFSAQATLSAAQAANPGSSNYMIVLTDGDANAVSTKMNTTCIGSGSGAKGCPYTANDSTGKSVTYPSATDECHQSILAANYASAQGTTVFTVSYGSPSTGCSTDTGAYAITPCSELQQMSSGYSSGNTSHFYADSTSACGGSETLNQIFAQIGGQFTSARLIPNGIT